MDWAMIVSLRTEWYGTLGIFFFTPWVVRSVRKARILQIQTCIRNIQCYQLYTYMCSNSKFSNSMKYDLVQALVHSEMESNHIHYSRFEREKILSSPKVENPVTITYVGISYWQLHQYLLGLLALYHEPNTRNCDFRTWMFLQQFFLFQNPTNPSLPSVEQSENVRKCLYLVEPNIESRILPTCITMLSYLQTFT